VEKGGGDPPPEAGTAVAPVYEPTPRELAALDTYHQRAAERPRARLKVTKKGTAAQIGPDHPNEAIGNVLLMEAVGTTSVDFLQGLLNQLVNAASKGAAPDEKSINFMLSVVKGIAPKDQVEAMLAAQMAAVHMASMTFARRLNHVETLPQQDSAERALNKLTRTFAAQVEALKCYRTGGEQKVTVEHVTVNAGGQAIVGSVTHALGGGGARKDEETTP
jgi:hypothetical protein